jgi:hypothetical protein
MIVPLKGLKFLEISVVMFNSHVWPYDLRL